MSAKDKKNRRFNAVEFKLDGIPDEEIKTLKAGIRRTALGIDIVLKTDKQQIQTNFVTGYQRPPTIKKPGFNFKHASKIIDTSYTSVEQNILNYDWLIAIDTNTIIIKNTKVHVGIVAEITDMTLENGKFIHPKIRYETHFAFQGEFDKPELINWKNTIKYIVGSESYNSSLKIGLIVDSELGSIQDFNQRKRTIIDDFFLPNNFHLLYASADTKNDSVLNQAIAFCDKSATQFLEAFRRNCH